MKELHQFLSRFDVPQLNFVVVFEKRGTSCRKYIMNEKRCFLISMHVLHDDPSSKADPGMRLLQRFLWQLAAKGMQNKIAFITDGRFSGTNKGCAVAHIAPEAMDGGPLAVVRDGDMIEIDIPNQKLRLDITDEELKIRMDAWKPPPSKVKKSYLAIYAKMTKAADKGAALRYNED